MVNSMMLLTHSVAALSGHQGPARNDERARRSPSARHRRAYVTTRRAGQAHAPGFVELDDRRRGDQHLVFDAEVVDGLVYAYRARKELRAARRDRRASCAARSHDTARGSFWRYPTIRLNQVNWYALMYAADATVTGDPTLLKRDLRAAAAALHPRCARDGARPATSAPGCASTTCRTSA